MFRTVFGAMALLVASPTMAAQPVGDRVAVNGMQM